MSVFVVTAGACSSPTLVAEATLAKEGPSRALPLLTFFASAYGL